MRRRMNGMSLNPGIEHGADLRPIDRFWQGLSIWAGPNFFIQRYVSTVIVMLGLPFTRVTAQNDTQSSRFVSHSEKHLYRSFR